MSSEEKRAKHTREEIVKAAGALFARKGYEQVTMREIASKAGCSHTTIYLYFDDKMSLLETIAAPVLRELFEEMKTMLEQAQHPYDRLHKMCRKMCEFGFTHRSLYPLYFMAEAERVDKANPKHDLNRLRNALFGLLQQAVTHVWGRCSQQQALNGARILFYQIHGSIMTYQKSTESSNALMKRVLPLVDQAVATLINGLPEVMQRHEHPIDPSV